METRMGVEGILLPENAKAGGESRRYGEGKSGKAIRYEEA